MKYLLIAMLFLAGCQHVNHYISESLKDTSDSSCVQIRLQQFSFGFNDASNYYLQYRFKWNNKFHDIPNEAFIECYEYAVMPPEKIRKQRYLHYQQLKNQP